MSNHKPGGRCILFVLRKRASRGTETRCGGDASVETEKARLLIESKGIPELRKWKETQSLSENMRRSLSMRL